MHETVARFSVRPEYLLIERPPGYEVVMSRQRLELEELAAACAAADRRKVLILGPRTTVKLDFIDLFDLGKQIASLGLQIAVVEEHDASDDNVTFLETVAFNRGGALRFFTDEQPAKDWLEVP